MIPTRINYSETVFCSGITNPFDDGLSFSPIVGNFNNFNLNEKIFVYPKNSIFDTNQNLIGFDNGPSGATVSLKEYSRGRYADAIFIPENITGNEITCGPLFLKGSFSNITNEKYILNQAWANGSTTDTPIQITGTSSIKLSTFTTSDNKEYVPYITTQKSSENLNQNNPMCYLNQSTEPNPNSYEKIYKFNISNRNDEWSFSDISVKMFFTGELEQQKITSFNVFLFPVNSGDVTIENGITLSYEYSTNPKIGGITGFYSLNDSSLVKATKSKSNNFIFGVKVDGANGCSLNGLMFKNEGKTEQEYILTKESYFLDEDPNFKEKQQQFEFELLNSTTPETNYIDFIE